MVKFFIHALLILCISIQNVIWVPAASANTIESQNSNKSSTNNSAVEYVEQLREAILNFKTHSLDSFRLLQQGTTEGDSPRNTFNNSDIRIVLKGQDQESIQSRLLRSYDNHYRSDYEKVEGFELVLPNAFTHQFYIPLKSISWNKDYIVFEELESNHTNRTLLFIDLNFVRPGFNELPIFRIPLIEFENKEFELSPSGLLIGERLIENRLLKDISKAQQTAFSMTANLLDVKRNQSNQALLSDFFETYYEQLSLQEKISQNANQGVEKIKVDIQSLLSNMQSELEQKHQIDYEKEQLIDRLPGKNLEEKKQALHDYIKDSEKPAEKVITELNKNQNIDKALTEIANQRAGYKKLSYKWNRATLYLSMPRPDGSAVIKTALLQTAAGIKEGNQEAFIESFYKLYANGKIQTAAIIGLGVFLGSNYPSETAGFIFQTLDISRTAFEHVWGKTSELSSLLWESTKATFSGFAPSVLHETYVADGKLAKTLVGLHALTTLMFTIMGIPHLVINSIKLSIDLFKYDFKNIPTDSPNVIRPFVKLMKAFIRRQNYEQQTYLQNLHDAENARLGIMDHEFTEKDNLRVKKYLELAEKRDFPKSKFYLWIQSIQKDKSSKKIIETKSRAQIDNLFKATVHFLFSFSSFTNTGVLYTFIWNNWFMMRTLVFRPNLWTYLLVYPKFFKVAVIAKNGKPHTPTEWNSGKTFGVPFASYLSGLFDGEKKAAQDKLEKSIIEVETKFEKIVLKKAIQETARFAKNQKVYEKLLEQNIEHFTDKVIFELNRKSRTFFQWYYHLAMEKLNDANFERLAGAPIESLNTKQKKQILMKLHLSPDSFSSDAELESFAKNYLNESLFMSATEKANKSILSISNFISSFTNKALHNMDPRYSGQFERYAIAMKQMKDPKAMARAVRATIVSMIVDKPIELAFLFIMIAGVSGGMVEPIHDVQFSENSWNFLSKYQFLSGFAYGLISGFLAETWMKLQQDARIDATGGFDNVPKGKQRRQGFWKNYFHEMKAPDNTWLQNQLYYAKLIWHNMGAAIVTMSVVQYFTLGRLDLDLIIPGYLIAYFSPFSGLAYKLENAFEKAASWVVRNIPTKYHSHPDVIQYSQLKTSRLRFIYNVFFAIYENSMDYIFSNLKTMSTPSGGPRSFARFVGGGYTITELLINHMDAAAEKYKFMEGPARFCRSAFLTNYTDGIKLNKPPK